MIELDNLDDALQLIDNNKYVVIIWHDKECEVCKFFLDAIKDIPIIVPEFKYATIQGDMYNERKIFEPDSAPVTFVFKDGIRLMAPPGQAPVEIIEENLRSIIDGTFKTIKELEEEQMLNLIKEDNV